MNKKRLFVALLMSITFNVGGAAIEAFAERRGANIDSYDAVVSWPAWLCSKLVPPGHGVPQLVFPFVFSLIFYTGFFWLLISFIGKMHRNQR